MIDFEVHGESFHRDYIEMLLSKYGRGKFVTVLVAEPENPYDPNAVAVFVDGGLVGRLPREVAPDWHPAVAAAAAEGFVVAGTGAIFGGTPDKPSLGIWGAAPWCGRGHPPKGCFDN
jgi:hypothetical protein